jgi:hypothetical protein
MRTHLLATPEVIAIGVLSRPLGNPGHHRQHGLGPVRRLDLRFLVDAEHQSPFGRVQIQADDIVDLVDDVRIGRQLEGLRAVRLQAERPPDP